MALLLWSRNTKAAALVIASMVIALSMHVVYPVAWHFFLEHFLDDYRGEDPEQRVLMYRLVLSILPATSTLLLVMAACRWREEAPEVPFAASGWEPAPGERPVRPISKSLYLGLLVVGGIASVLASGAAIVLFLQGEDRLMFAGFVLIGVAVLIYLGLLILGMRLIYRMWCAIPRDFARTTPGLAIGLSLIPIFNLYWIFQVHWGWTVDFNRFAEARGVRARAPEGLALAICIMSLIAIIPYVGGIFALVNMVLGCIYISSVCDGINAVAASQLQGDARFRPPAESVTDRF